jgi:hypothetical protein
MCRWDCRSIYLNIECFCKMTKATRRIVGSPWPREFLGCQQSVVVFKEPDACMCYVSNLREGN